MRSGASTGLEAEEYDQTTSAGQMSPFTGSYPSHT